jgi:uncharacterized membrane protein
MSVPVATGYEQKTPNNIFGRWAVHLPIFLGSAAIGLWSWLAFFRPLGIKGLLAAGVVFTFTSAFFFLAARLASIVDGDESHALQQELAKCSLAFALLLLFLPEYTARVRPPVLRSSLLLLTFSVLWIVLYSLCRRRAAGIHGWPVDRAIWPVITAVSLFFALTALALRKLYVFGYVGQDLAYFAQIMHTTLHGHLFWGSLLQDLLYSQPVTTDFAGHNSPIMFLFLPFYALHPSPVTLIVLRNLVMVLCAYPAYKIASIYAGEGAARLWSVAFLMVPTLFYQSTFDFYPLSFAVLPLLFTLYYYLSSRFTPFCVALAFTLAVREDLALFALALGMVALLQKRSARWAITPFLSGLGWALLSYFVVLPHALHGASFVTDACFSHLGKTPGDMFAHICSSPQTTVLAHNNIVYLKELLTPNALILPFGSAMMLPALPFIGINLLAGAGKCITTIIYAQYSVVPAAVLFVATLLASANSKSLFGRLSRLGIKSESTTPMIYIALCIASLLFVTGEQQAAELRNTAWTDEAYQVASLIPEDASVAAPRYLLPTLANRDCLYQTHRLSQYHHPVYEYLILDNDWSHINADGEYQAAYASLLQTAPSNPAFETIYKSPQFTVLQDRSMHGKSCFPGDASQ